MGEPFDMDEAVARGQRGQFGNTPPPKLRRSQWDDLRLSIFDHQAIAGKRGLYIGHGDGSVPIQISLQCHPTHLDCIDIDPKMTVSAVQNLLLVEAGMSAPEPRPLLAYYRDEAFGFGLLQAERPSGALRKMLTFRKNNILSLTGDFAYAKFDFIFCLRLTKYIHLNFGDEAIHILFHNISQLLAPGGALFFEAQPLVSYQRSKNRFPAFKGSLAQIKVKPDDFLHLLKNVHGLTLVKSIDYPRQGQKRKSTVHVLNKL